MVTIITVIHVVACIFLVLVVLLQTGKGADMGAVFGGSSSTVFGSSGAGNFLTRLTTGAAVAFMLTSLSLTYLGGRQGVSTTVFDTAPQEEPLPGAQQPAAPAAAPIAQQEPVAPVEVPAAQPAEAPAAAPAPAEAPPAAPPEAAPQ